MCYLRSVAEAPVTAIGHVIAGVPVERPVFCGAMIVPGARPRPVRAIGRTRHVVRARIVVALPIMGPCGGMAEQGAEGKTCGAGDDGIVVGARRRAEGDR